MYFFLIFQSLFQIKVVYVVPFRSFLFPWLYFFEAFMQHNYPNFSLSIFLVCIHFRSGQEYLHNLFRINSMSVSPTLSFAIKNLILTRKCFMCYRFFIPHSTILCCTGSCLHAHVRFKERKQKIYVEFSFRSFWCYSTYTRFWCSLSYKICIN